MPHARRADHVASPPLAGSAKILDLVKGEVVQTFKHAKFVVRVAFSPDGKWLATASYDRTIALYSLDPATGPAPPGGADDDELAEDPLDVACPLRWELRRNFECVGNPEGLVFGPQLDGEEDWLAYTERCVFSACGCATGSCIERDGLTSPLARSAQGRQQP